MQLNRPYYVAVSVNVKDPSDKGVTFYLKDLANDEEPLGIYSTTHKVVKMAPARGNFTIGGTTGKLERSWETARAGFMPKDLPTASAVEVA